MYTKGRHKYNTILNSLASYYGLIKKMDTRNGRRQTSLFVWTFVLLIIDERTHTLNYNNKSRTITSIKPNNVYYLLNVLSVEKMLFT